ncbi:hypothetical protein M413DRAFT_133546 [Hebeloma cylindrosporum]|uniref:Uncharacterized protein n=1 Tax=Hebeloma cylindrosporum TaxID=76867 RepID=A0A0C2YN02_HEBCY|nr:hypothetical protein M413DRAFT_133546 [Hebeloma cylindrosporum h7]
MKRDPIFYPIKTRKRLTACFLPYIDAKNHRFLRRLTSRHGRSRMVYRCEARSQARHIWILPRALL